MKTKLVFRLGIGPCLALFILLFVAANLHSRQSSHHIFMDSHTPEAAEKAIAEVFPHGEIIAAPNLHLEQFIKGGEAAFAYDVQALALLKSDESLCFYPLYTDRVVIAVDRAKTGKSITGWEDLKSGAMPVSFPRSEPELLYIWAALGHAYGGELGGAEAPDYLRALRAQNRLLWDDPAAPVQVLLFSHLPQIQTEQTEFEVICPREGTLSFDAGLLTHAPLTKEQADILAAAYEQDGYPPCGSFAGQTHILPAAELLSEFMSYRGIGIDLNRRVLDERHFTPADAGETFLLSLLVIVLLVFWTARTQKQVVHRGVRRGLCLTGALLIGWVGLGIFKHAIFGYPLIEFMAWYAFYFFLLALPVIALYISENADRGEMTRFPLWLKLNGAVACLLLLTVLTNNLHHWVFAFPEDGGRYTYEPGYYLLSAWFLLSQFSAFFLLLKKSWDSPKRKTTLFPAAVVLLGLAYSILYNIDHPLWSRVPLAIGMSLLTTGFWQTAIITGLIPANRRYRALFESSTLNLQIFDNAGALRYRSEGATPLAVSLSQEELARPGSLPLPKEEALLWTTPISGGYVAAREDIHHINSLRRRLEALNRRLHEENQILGQRALVESRIALVREQNRLTAQVNDELKAQLREMQALLPALQASGMARESAKKQILRRSFYCKRRCEFLLKERQGGLYPSRELARLMRESAEVFGFTLYAPLDAPLPCKDALLLYRACHAALDAVCGAELTALAAALLSQPEGICLTLMVTEKAELLEQAISPLLAGRDDLRLTRKSLEDVFSVALTILGGEANA